MDIGARLQQIEELGRAAQRVPLSSSVLVMSAWLVLTIPGPAARGLLLLLLLDD